MKTSITLFLLFITCTFTIGQQKHFVDKIYDKKIDQFYEKVDGNYTINQLINDSQIEWKKEQQQFLNIETI